MAGEDLSAIYASLGLGNPTATANDLSSFQSNVLATDPWNIAAKSLGSFQPNMSTWSPTTQIATSFGKNFLAGLMGQYARNDAAEQLKTVASLMPQLRSDPLNVAFPENVDSSAAETLRSNMVLKNLEAKAAGASDNQGLLRDMLKTVIGEKAKTDPEGALSSLAKYQQTGDVKSILSSTSGALASTPEVKKEQTTDAIRKQTLDFVSEKYNQAKSLTGGEAAWGKLTGLFGVPNDKAAALESLGDTIVLQADKAIDKELNTDVRNRLLSLAPKWFDTPDTIARKEADAKALVSSLFDPTPALDKAGLSTKLEAPTAPKQTYKASELIAQGYTKGADGWYK